MTQIDFTVTGLSKGDWKEAEVFYRGNGEVIGCEKIDESLLEEARKQERLQEVVEEFEDEAGSTSNDQVLVGSPHSYGESNDEWQTGNKLF